MVRLLVLICSIGFSSNIFAAITQWHTDPTKSELGFTAIQNNAPVNGYFKKFTTDIHFDEDNLKESHIKVTVDTNSVSTSYPELTSTLISNDWFNTKQYPIAIFEAHSFERTDTHTYKAIGTLTIKDKSEPVTLLFSAKLPTKDTAIVIGSTTIQRNLFTVGEGDWSSTDEIKNDVKISFTLNATKNITT